MTSGASSAAVNALKSQTGLIVGHWISFGVTLVMMIVVDFMTIKSLKQRRKLKPCFRRFGPLILCLLATVFIMAEPTRHVLSDNGVWPLCWAGNGTIPRINQTWNDACVASSLEYECNIPCCVPMEEYKEEFPNNDPPAGTRNESLLNLTDPAWQDHFWYDHCVDAEGHVFDYLNATTNKPNCNKPKDSVDYLYHGDVGETGLTYERILECTCDACVQVETMQFLSPVGWIFTVTLTYSGFVLLAIGALWNANIVKKIKKLKEKCRELKDQKARQTAGGEAGFEEGGKSGSVSVAVSDSGSNNKAATEGTNVPEIGGGEFDLKFDAPQDEDCSD